MTDHTDARSLGSLSGNVDQIRNLFELRTPYGWLVPLGFLAFVFSRPARPTWPLWTLVPAAAGFLVLVRPLTDHHLVLLSVAGAIAAGPSLALAIGDRVQVGSDSTLVAPISLGDDVYVATATTLRHDIPAGALAFNERQERVREGWTEQKREKMKGIKK